MLRVPMEVWSGATLAAQASGISINTWITNVMRGVLGTGGEVGPSLFDDDAAELEGLVAAVERDPMAHKQLEPVPLPEPEPCEHPRAAERQLGWGVMCGACGEKLR